MNKFQTEKKPKRKRRCQRTLSGLKDKLLSSVGSHETFNTKYVQQLLKCNYSSAWLIIRSLQNFRQLERVELGIYRKYTGASIVVRTTLEKILEYFTKSETFSTKELCKATGKSRAAINKSLFKLKREGALTLVTRGVYKYNG